jgi:hypothetical protein
MVEQWSQAFDQQPAMEQPNGPTGNQGMRPAPQEAVSGHNGAMRERISRAITQIMRHEHPGQEFTIGALMGHIRLQPPPSRELLELVLRSQRRRGDLRFVSRMDAGQLWWRLR